MENIGERLEEARKRKGLSIREAAEATKIRGDFLMAFENNRFGDISLPEIYKRGFLKNYSVFLNMDYEKILADYTAHQLGNSRLARKEGREFFGRMDMPNAGRRQATEPAEPVVTGDNEEVGPAAAQTTTEGNEPEPMERPARDSRISGGDEAASLFAGDKTLYWKIGLAAGSAFILFLLIFALFKAVTSGGGGETPPRINDTPPQNGPTTTTGTDTPPPGDLTQVILVGTGETFVQVKQIENGEILYQGTLSSGGRVPLQIRGSADIAFTNGQNLRIIKDEKNLYIAIYG